ncbi:MAG: class I SAM-dependent methyltransferase [Burkholderiales bacterium]|nr:class I SAM-dependent methyltransferase [Burkholderiales bacterium]
MNVLIAGPTGAGKSTLIHSPELAGFLAGGRAPSNVVYGYELVEGDIPDNALIHYNLLHTAHSLPVGAPDETGIPWDFEDDPIFRKIMTDRRLRLAIVLVTPAEELAERTRNRQFVEERVVNKSPYDGQHWRNVIARTNLPATYEQFFRHLEQRSIPYIVVYSSARTPARFCRSDRVFVPANLRGTHVAPPSPDDIASILALEGCHYQSVLLPGGVVTDKGQYAHIDRGRHETFEMILSESLWNRSVLDIGCALGDLLYRAERLGAGRMVGIEPHAGRYAAANAIAHLLHSKAEIRNCGFMEFGEDEQFDHVFMLNVLHHVKDFHAFLAKACGLARRSLTIEFPTLADAKFSQAVGHPLAGFLNWLPLVGVSSHAVDQAYVFSPKAIENICFREIGGFSGIDRFKSPLKHRQIMVFHR